MGEPDHAARAVAELAAWRARQLRPAGALDRAARKVQDRIIALTPERVHAVVTGVIEQMIRGVMFGSHHTTVTPPQEASAEARETRMRERIGLYRATAATEGGVAGAGGFLLAAADFPALIAIKLKLLFDLAALDGRDTAAFPERLLILLIFRLAFSSPGRRAEALAAVEAWIAGDRPQSLEEFDWRGFQQEYRDYIDLAKLAQLIPVIGAPVGAVVNYRMTSRLGEAALNVFRMRRAAETGLL